MHRILRFVEREVKGLHETAYLLSFFALLSTGMALFRDRFLASLFGAGETLDIYYAAFRIPDLVFILVASLVSVFILVPVLTSKKSVHERHAVMGTVVTAFSLVMIFGSVVLFLLMPHLMELLFPRLVEKDNTLVVLSRILLLQPFFMGLSGIFAAVTQIHGRYILYAVAPVLYNVGILFGILVLYPLVGVIGIAWGVVFGAVMHMGLQVPFVLREGYLRVRDMRIHPPVLWSIIRVAIPRTVTLAAASVALFFMVMIAALLKEGSVSVFTLAFNLQSAPLSIIGASYSVAAFPVLARHFSEGDVDRFCNQVIIATRHILFWSMPIIGLSVVLRAHIVRVALGAGEFSWADTRLTAAALALFIVALSAQALSLLFLRGFYAAGYTRTPLIVNVVTAFGMVVGSYALIWAFEHISMWRYFVEDLLRVDGINGTAVLMLPLSFAFFSIINVIWYVILFERKFGLLWRHVHKTVFASFAAAIVCGFASREVLRFLEPFVNIGTFFGVFIVGCVAGLVGVLVAWFIYYLLDSKELKEISHLRTHRMLKCASVIKKRTP